MIIKTYLKNSHYNTFEMSKEFIEKIIGNPIEPEILKNIEHFWNQQIKVFHERQQSL